jgi:hypothetical protein
MDCRRRRYGGSREGSREILIEFDGGDNKGGTDEGIRWAAAMDSWVIWEDENVKWIERKEDKKSWKN